MSHTPTTYLIGSTECRGFYAYPTVWLLSSGIMQQLTMLVNFPSTSWVFATFSHHRPWGNFLPNYAMDLS